jgi:hypothetical protein
LWETEIKSEFIPNGRWFHERPSAGRPALAGGNKVPPAKLVLPPSRQVKGALVRSGQA